MAIHQEPQADIERTTFGTTAEVTVGGELDIASTPDFEHVIGDALRAGVERVIIDLCGATFIDSSAVNALLRLHRHATAQQIDLIILRPHGEADRIFEICGIEGVFPKLDGSRKRSAGAGRDPGATAG